MSPRLALLAASLAAAACSGPPREGDFLLPPYAEKGCWARFYEHAGFGEPVRQIEGPTFVEAIPGGVVEVPNMHEAGVQPLFVEARSLVVGPRARLIVYREPQRFASLRLECKA
jgi:hypothetical protein